MKYIYLIFCSFFFFLLLDRTLIVGWKEGEEKNIENTIAKFISFRFRVKNNEFHNLQINFVNTREQLFTIIIVQAL